MGVTIAIDCMGGDHGPVVTVPAALSFLRSHPDASAVLVGREEALKAEVITGEAPGTADETSWALDLSWAPGKTTTITGAAEHAVKYRNNGFDYALRCGRSPVQRAGDQNHIRIGAVEGAVVLGFGGEQKR